MVPAVRRRDGTDYLKGLQNHPGVLSFHPRLLMWQSVHAGTLEAPQTFENMRCCCGLTSTHPEIPVGMLTLIFQNVTGLRDRVFNEGKMRSSGWAVTQYHWYLCKKKRLDTECVTLGCPWKSKGL